MKTNIKYVIFIFLLPLYTFSQIHIFQPAQNDVIIIGKSFTVKWTKNYFGPVDLYYKLESDNDWRLFKRGIFVDSVVFDVNIKIPSKIDFLAKTFTYTPPICIDTIVKAHDNEIREAVFSKDNSKIISLDKFDKVRLWDWRNTQLLNEITVPTAKTLSSTKFNNDESKVLISSDSSIYIWDLTKVNNIKELSFHSRYSSLDFHPFLNKIIVASYDGFVQLINLDNDSIELKIPSNKNVEVYCTGFSKDGKSVVWGTGNGFIETYNLLNGQSNMWEAHGLLGQNKVIWSVNYSPDSKYILSGSVDDSVRYWDAITGDTIYSFNEHTFHVRSVKNSNDGRFALSGSLDMTARQYDLNYGFSIPNSVVNHGGQIISVGYSSDDNYFLTTGRDNSIKIWKNIDSIKFKDSTFAYLKFQATVSLPHIETQTGKRINAMLSFDNKFDLTGIANTKYRANCEIEYPYTMLDKVLDKTFIKNVKLDTIKLDIFADFKDRDIKSNLFNVLSSYQKYGDLNILKFEITENDIFDVLKDSGSVKIVEDCPGNNQRNIEISGLSAGIILNTDVNPKSLIMNLVEDASYTLEIVGIKGELIETKFSEKMKPGEYTMPLNFENFATGNYFISLKWNNNQNSVKFLIIK